MEQRGRFSTLHGVRNHHAEQLVPKRSQHRVWLQVLENLSQGGLNQSDDLLQVAKQFSVSVLFRSTQKVGEDAEVAALVRPR